jgi:hypothetical protein
MAIKSNKKTFQSKILKGTIMASLDKKFGGRDSVVGIVFRYVLEGSGFVNLSRNVQIFPAPSNVPVAPSPSLKMGICSLSQGY